MLQSLTSGISGLRTHQQRMDVIANDIANVNTVAYKQNEVSFKEALVDTIRMPSVGSPGIQMGMGTALSGITKDFSFGMLESTGMASNLALQGEGFFVVMNTDDGGDPTGVMHYTRAGDFVLDVKGEGENVVINLINSDGMVLMNTDGEAVDLNQGSGLSSFSIATDGVIIVVDRDGELHVGDDGAGTVRVVVFDNNNGLNSVGASLYTWTNAAGAEPADADDNPPNAGLIQQGYLESSNTELAKEFTEMIVTQRGFQANSRTITTSDEVLQELLTLKR